jgi:CheY-like chemotaxis protein
VQGLLKLFGGQVAVESRVGEGTTFTVTIPVGPVDAATLPDVAAPRARGEAHAQVLIVDDNRLIRESLAEMATFMGYDAATAGTAKAALAWLDLHRCDAVLLDLHMPDEDGYAFLAEFDARGGSSAGVPVIAISADVPEGRPAGADAFFAYLAKPVHYEQLRDVLLRALAARSAA